MDGANNKSYTAYNRLQLCGELTGVDQKTNDIFNTMNILCLTSLGLTTPLSLNLCISRILIAKNQNLKKMKLKTLLLKTLEIAQSQNVRG